MRLGFQGQHARPAAYTRSQFSGALGRAGQNADFWRPSDLPYATDIVSAGSGFQLAICTATWRVLSFSAAQKLRLRPESTTEGRPRLNPSVARTWVRDGERAPCGPIEPPSKLGAGPVHRTHCAAKRSPGWGNLGLGSVLVQQGVVLTIDLLIELRNLRMEMQRFLFQPALRREAVAQISG